MQIYEPGELKSAWMLESGADGWAFALETADWQFVLGTDRPYRAATLGALLLVHMNEQYDPKKIDWDCERGWDAWVFDKRINAMTIRELHREWDGGEERKVGEAIPIPTLEEAEEIYAAEGVPQCMSDVRSVFSECEEVGPDGRPKGPPRPIDDFWREGRFLICRDWRTRGDKP